MTEVTPQAVGPGKPPNGVSGVEAELAMPREMPPAVAAGGNGDSAPTLPAEAGVASGIGAWNNNKQITALWSINQDKNSWVGVSGVGWKRLANNSGSAIVALTMLSAHARQKGSIVNYRDESDGMIHEMYVW